MKVGLVFSISNFFKKKRYVSGNKWMLFNYSNSALQSDNDYFKLIATFQSSKGVDANCEL